MKPATTSMTGSRNTPIIASRKFITLDTEKLYQAVWLLEQAGFTVTTAPIELWQFCCILTAYDPVTGEGYLIGPDELGLIIHYGVAYLNPHEFTEPRYKAKDNSNRIKHYAEAAIARVCTDVALAAPGTSNQALNKAAYTIGRFMFGWQLDPDSIQAHLLGVALDRGINEHEAKAVIKAGVRAGEKKPRDPSDLMNAFPFDEQPSSSNKRQAPYEKNRFNEHHNTPSEKWVKPSPWGR